MLTIYTKPDVGTYTYDDTKINAVVNVTNEPGNISNNTQNITYIGYNKASVIAENGYELDYTYGPDFSRKYSVLKNAGATINTRTYSGTYEINDDQSSNPQQLHYIYGNNGLVAIIVKNNSGTNDYYTYTDQLGSILTVTDNSATVVAQQNFDVWGRNRNPTDWSYASIPSVPNWLYRGYTSHEMLPQFGLINMNGRMYDPLLGRMLSPDNNIYGTTSTQAYNRYSYCLNNPLKYTDPTGWDPGILMPWLTSPLPIINGTSFGYYDIGSLGNGSTNYNAGGIQTYGPPSPSGNAAGPGATGSNGTSSATIRAENYTVADALSFTTNAIGVMATTTALMVNNSANIAFFNAVGDFSSAIIGPVISVGTMINDPEKYATTGNVTDVVVNAGITITPYVVTEACGLATGEMVAAEFTGPCAVVIGIGEGMSLITTKQSLGQNTQDFIRKMNENIGGMYSGGWNIMQADPNGGY